VVCQPVEDGSHGVFADAEVQVAARLGALLEATLTLDGVHYMSISINFRLMNDQVWKRTKTAEKLILAI